MLARNGPAQYDVLAAQWWNPHGAFAMLHWLAAQRASLLPPPSTPGAPLVDIGCGGGLNAPHVHGYTHIGVDIRETNLRHARAHGVHGVLADATSLPLADESAEVVIAGEILEHVDDWRSAIAEACRILRPQGTLILDTIAATALARFVAVTLAERVPGGPPSGIHDPALFVPPTALTAECARHGVQVRLWGLRPAVGQLLRWLLTRRGEVELRRIKSKSILYAGRGIKHG